MAIAVLYLLTNLPQYKASAKRVARLYRKRWTLETAFQHLEAYFHSEINTSRYPKAALVRVLPGPGLQYVGGSDGGLAQRA